MQSCNPLPRETLITKDISSGVLSTVFLWMVDIDQSRKECAEFIAAEGSRNAFTLSVDDDAGLSSPVDHSGGEIKA